MKKWLLLPSFVLTQIASQAMAQEFNPYQFSGACGSQGPWTQQALQRTSELRSVLTKLKDDPNCRVFHDKMVAGLNRIDAEVSPIDGQATHRASALPQEIAALRTFATGDSSVRGPVLDAMFSRMIENTRPGIEAPDTTSAADQNGQQLISLGKRISYASSRSLRVFNETIDVLPQVQECLTDPSITGQMLAASVQFVSAIASSGSNQNSAALAQTIAKLANYSRMEKFAKSLRELKENEFMASLACLLEMTAENYCSTRDARLLADDIMKEGWIEQAEDNSLRLRPDTDRFMQLQKEGSPLAGYYLLTQNIPVVTSWLQMIQLGAEPRLMSDATQKNDPITQLAEFQKKANELRATANSQIEMINTYASIDEQRLAAVKLVKGLYSAITGVGGFGISSASDNQNFFTLSMAPVDVAFYLIGMDTPDAVKARDGLFPQSVPDWLDSNYMSVPAFSNPVNLARRVDENLRSLIARADNSAITFYQKWFIVDKVLIVNRALIGVNYNVRDSLQLTVQYLDHLRNKTIALNADPSILPLIHDTRTRIIAVLKQFARLELLGKSLTQTKDPERMAQATKQVTEDLIKETFNQFIVMLAKSGWLASRMADFVQADFQMMKRAGKGLDAHAKELYTVSGRALVDQIIRMSEGNPAALTTDLAMAMRLGKGNIEALETGLNESYVNQIAMLDHVVRGARFADGHTLWAAKHSEDFNAQVDVIPGQGALRNNAAVRGVSGIWRAYLSSVGDLPRLWNKTSETWSTPTRRLSPDDEFNSAALLKAQICTQTLAFNNLKPFWNLCKTTELESPFLNTPMASGLQKTFTETLNVNYVKKAYEQLDHPAVNHSARICAFRDFNRRNMVLYLTKGMRK